jgi:ribosome-associated protein
MVSIDAKAKSVIAESRVLVNGEVETRKRKKIVSGDIVEFGKRKFVYSSNKHIKSRGQRACVMDKK